MRQQFDGDMVLGSLRAVAEACVVLVRRVAELIEQLEPQDAGSSGRDLLRNLLGSQPETPEAMHGEVIISHAARTVTYRGRTCALGNTLAFRMMERLARRPNEYVSFNRLIREVWDGHPRSDDAIRSVVKELRRRLEKSGMYSLAAAIHGEKRAYVLNLNGPVMPRSKRR